MSQIVLIQDLAWGDSGKGTMTDYFSRALQAKYVVRFNGGSQAGHTVQLPNGTRHVFSQYGSGTFAGANTYLSKYMLVNPNAMYHEAVRLQDTGVSNPLSLMTVSPDCLITTPFHIFGNKTKEELRGDFKHGSCGMGIGETVDYSLKFPETCLRVKDLAVKSLAKEKMAAISNYYLDLFEEPALESGLFDESTLELVLNDYMDWESDIDVVPDDDMIIYMIEQGNIVFEGAQGVLLDQVYGFNPHTTWSNCTFENADSLLKNWLGEQEISRVGVLRAYSTRHGEGPLITKSDELKDIPADETNVHNKWQGSMRRGYFDLNLTKYALKTCGQVDEIVLTCMDHTAFIPDYKVCTRYSIKGRITDSLLKWAAPIYESVDVANIPNYLEEQLNTTIRHLSYGPTYKDKKMVK